MERDRLQSRIGFIVLLLIAAGQFISTLHAAEFGGEPHSHNNGVSCVVLVSDDEDDLFFPPALIHTTVIFTDDTEFFSTDHIAIVIEDTGHVLPPSTGPPALI